VLREAIGRLFGLDSDRIICRRRLGRNSSICWRQPISSRRRSRSTTHGFPGLSDRDHGDGAKNVVAAEKEHTADVDAT